MPAIVQDPTGLEIVLTDECWRHVVSRHPEMEPFKELVLKTIREPDGIYAGKRDPSRRIYRKSYSEVPGVGNSLDVLVFVGDDGKHVATAYLIGYSIRMLGRLVWPTT
jgi:phage-Barnase-EndoU-ColicinE5/D-RelE like nuclease2